MMKLSPKERQEYELLSKKEKRLYKELKGFYHALGPEGCDFPYKMIIPSVLYGPSNITKLTNRTEIVNCTSFLDELDEGSDPLVVTPFSDQSTYAATGIVDNRGTRRMVSQVLGPVTQRKRRRVVFPAPPLLTTPDHPIEPYRPTLSTRKRQGKKEMRVADKTPDELSGWEDSVSQRGLPLCTPPPKRRARTLQKKALPPLETSRKCDQQALLAALSKQKEALKLQIEAVTEIMEIVEGTSWDSLADAFQTEMPHLGDQSKKKSTSRLMNAVEDVRRYPQHPILTICKRHQVKRTTLYTALGKTTWYKRNLDSTTEVNDTKLRAAGDAWLNDPHQSITSLCNEYKVTRYSLQKRVKLLKKVW